MDYKEDNFDYYEEQDIEYVNIDEYQIKQNIEIDNYLNSDVRHGDSLVANLEEYLMSKR